MSAKKTGRIRCNYNRNELSTKAIEEGQTIWVGSNPKCDICLRSRQIVPYHLGISFDAKKSGFWVLRETPADVHLLNGSALPIGEEKFVPAGEGISLGEGHWLMLECTAQNTKSSSKRTVSLLLGLIALIAICAAAIYLFRKQGAKTINTKSFNKQDWVDAFCYIIGIAALLGFVLYLPLRSHWSRIFSTMDAIIFYTGIATPLLYLYCRLDDSTGLSSESFFSSTNLTFVLVAGGFALAGIVVLISCWTRCSNLLEVILLPFIMIMMIGVMAFALMCIGLCLAGLGHGDGNIWYYEE